ncbi:hypothetical protein SAMN05443144_105149 [Fodinibius roseus]|uniref:Antibiotic biosynthesis monooxygenase n=1 Tax=Fodinibius roseus TaxID=1194090 RepID=A0A1M4YT60_9BACT|nr:hypothetical protein [Fodinibius roseus]SHF08941.1 hypothetical protein SAMN05443144_105149 [Fodinibius roseus]
MISRHWTGVAKKARADEYVHHLKTDTFKQIEQIAGFISAQILKREVEEGIEFLIITECESLDAIKQFAGEKLDRAVVPPPVQDIMVQYDDKVRHYKESYKTA